MVVPVEWDDVGQQALGFSRIGHPRPEEIHKTGRQRMMHCTNESLLVAHCR